MRQTVALSSAAVKLHVVRMAQGLARSFNVLVARFVDR
jgi:hypothetical protein